MTNLEQNNETPKFGEFKGKWGISTEVGEKTELTKIFNKHGHTVCAIYTKPFTKEEKRANAQLISKAPEMLEMLNNLLSESKKGWRFEFPEKEVEQLIKEATEL